MLPFSARSFQLDVISGANERQKQASMYAASLQLPWAAWTVRLNPCRVVALPCILTSSNAGPSVGLQTAACSYLSVSLAPTMMMSRPCFTMLTICHLAAGSNKLRSLEQSACIMLLHLLHKAHPAHHRQHCQQLNILLFYPANLNVSATMGAYA